MKKMKHILFHEISTLRATVKLILFLEKEEIIAYQTNVSDINISNIKSKFLEEVKH